MILAPLAIKSLLNRRATAILSILSIALSVALLLGVEKVRTGAKEGFLNTISGTDLIVGARTSGVQLLLYSVFHIGNATNNISMETVEDIASRKEVRWLVPVSLGDSYRGFRVVGTTQAFFEHYRYRDAQPLALEEGAVFNGLFDVVIGSKVAAKENHILGEEIVLSHGTGRVSFSDHKEKPFTVSGVLKPTGTPVDRSVFVSLKAIEAIHHNWQPGQDNATETPDEEELQPKAVTAALIGLKSKIATFGLQRFINGYSGEPVTAILPGVAFAELWTVISGAELALIAVSALVVVTAISGMMISILSTLSERRREMAILRSVGARPRHIFMLFCLEAVFIALAGVGLGILAIYSMLALARPAIEQATGLLLAQSGVSQTEAMYLGCVVLGGLLAGLVPAVRALRMSLADGLTIRV